MSLIVQFIPAFVVLWAVSLEAFVLNTVPNLRVLSRMTSERRGNPSLIDRIRGGNTLLRFPTRERDAATEVADRKRLEKALDEDEEPRSKQSMENLSTRQDAVSRIPVSTSVAAQGLPLASASGRKDNFIRSFLQVPETLLTQPITESEVNIKGAAAIAGAVLGLVVAGPLGAFIGASLANYSASTGQTDASEAARGTGRWMIAGYNFFAKVNGKLRFVQKVGNVVLRQYGKLKAATRSEQQLGQAEEVIKSSAQNTAKLAGSVEFSRFVAQTLFLTAEVGAASARALVEYDRQHQVLSKTLAFLQRELVEPAQRSRSIEKKAS